MISFQHDYQIADPFSSIAGVAIEIDSRLRKWQMYSCPLCLERSPVEPTAMRGVKNAICTEFLENFPFR